MKKELIARLHKSFEDFVHTEEGIEFWYARDLQALLGYSKWDNFVTVIEKAKDACQNAGNTPQDHFADAGKMVDAPAMAPPGDVYNPFAPPPRTMDHEYNRLWLRHIEGELVRLLGGSPIKHFEWPAVREAP